MLWHVLDTTDWNRLPPARPIRRRAEEELAE
jgi:hypothetical protein